MAVILRSINKTLTISNLVIECKSCKKDYLFVTNSSGCCLYCNYKTLQLSDLTLINEVFLNAGVSLLNTNIHIYSKDYFSNLLLKAEYSKLKNA